VGTVAASSVTTIRRTVIEKVGTAITHAHLDRQPKGLGRSPKGSGGWTVRMAVRWMVATITERSNVVIAHGGETV
jgi:hypothetical protein